MLFKNSSLVNKLFFIFLLIVFALFFSLPLLKKERYSNSNFLNSNFQGYNLNTSTSTTINNIYPLEIKGNLLIPEEIFIKKYDVLKLTNSTNDIVRIRNLDSSFITLNPGEEFFKKFEENGEYSFEIVNLESNSSLYGKIYVKD